MILAGNQPYFLPYIGYFQLINIADRFIIDDTLQYVNKGWINRNRILCNGKIKLFTLPLINISRSNSISNFYLTDFNNEYFIKLITHSYCKAPFFYDVFPLFKEILSYSQKQLNYFLLNSLQITCDYLGITTPLILNSERNDITDLRKEERVIYLCKSLKAKTCINAIGGQTLYSKENFAKEGITLKFIKPELTPYKQLRTQEFVPALSILDVMMNVPRDEIREMLNHYSLI